MAPPIKYSSDEERAAARRAQKLAWFHRNGPQVNEKKRRTYREKRDNQTQTASQHTPTPVVKEKGGSISSMSKDCDSVDVRVVVASDTSDKSPMNTPVASEPPRMQKPGKARQTIATPTPVRPAPYTGRSNYWVTCGVVLLKAHLKLYGKSVIPESERDLCSGREKVSIYGDHCAFWENVLERLLPLAEPVAGLRKWGAMLYVELTRAIPDPALDPRTTAKRECKRLEHEIDELCLAVRQLFKICSGIDPFGREGLLARAEKVYRTSQLLSNIVGELTLLYDCGMDGLVEAHHNGGLNYQNFCY